jgi:hypothetical protein
MPISGDELCGSGARIFFFFFFFFFFLDRLDSLTDSQ